MIGSFLGIVEKPHFYIKTAVATFWETIGQILEIIGLLFTPTSGLTGWGRRWHFENDFVQGEKNNHNNNSMRSRNLKIKTIII